MSILPAAYDSCVKTGAYFMARTGCVFFYIEKNTECEKPSLLLLYSVL